MVGTPAGPMIVSATGSDTALAVGPTMAWTPSVSTKRRAFSTPSSGSRVKSASTPSTGNPNTPPASLTCRIAKSKARFLSDAVSEGLLKLSISPIFMDAVAPGSSGTPPSQAAATTTRPTATMNLTRFVMADYRPSLLANCTRDHSRLEEGSTLPVPTTCPRYIWFASAL